ncbi:MAG: mannitol dehydrogenase family protein [Propionibacteriaceae bacterium]|jgi:fructuronate reductase|nr:mannitol dehydrogenase family protein [Propionibacteriaceae bacterium]
MTDRPRSRLGPETLARLSRRPDVDLPAFDPHDLGLGLVHLGLGAFHRAHQAVYTELAAAAGGDRRWGIAGVSPRHRAVKDRLDPQDGLYSVLTLGADRLSLRVVGSLRAALFAPAQTETVLDLMAQETTHIISLTITEQGYTPWGLLGPPAVSGDGPATGPEGGAALGLGGGTAMGPDAGAITGWPAELAAAGRELAGRAEAGRPTGGEALGLLLRGLARRFRQGGQPITLLSCDNLVANGRVLRHRLAELAQGLDDTAFSQWLADHVACPSTMVDRIVPATSSAHHRLAQDLLGLDDAGLVVGEPFLQWVIEDRFAGPRPPWERAGATLADEVEPYELVKLRLLNAAHSAAAYLGCLRGRSTIAQAMADPFVRQRVTRLTDDDLLPTLTAPPGLDLTDYRDQVFARFDNPHIGHSVLQVARDGSTKLPQRLLGAVQEGLAAGATPRAGAEVVAAWCLFVRAAAGGRLRLESRPVTLEDPQAARLAAAAQGPAPGLADRLLALRTIFPPAIGDHDGFRQAVRDSVAELSRALRPPD